MDTLKDKKQKLFDDALKYDLAGDKDKLLFCRYLMFQICSSWPEEYEEFRRAYFVNQENKL